MEVRPLQRRGMRNEVAGMQGEEVLSRHVRRALGSPTVQRRWIGLGSQTTGVTSNIAFVAALYLEKPLS